MLKQPLSRFMELVEMFGPARSVAIAARWLVRRDYLVLVRDLHLPLPELPADETLRWTTLTEADVPRVSALNPAVSEPEIRGRLREGHTCTLCWVGESLAYCRWYTTKSMYLAYLGVVFQPAPGDLLAEDSFTHPSFRGRGIFTAGALRSLQRARRMGCRRSITLTAAWNAPSFRVTQGKAGRTVAGRVGFWTVGLGRRYFATGDVRIDKPKGLSGPAELRVQAAPSAGLGRESPPTIDGVDRV